jgi:hypothetical protein
VAPCCLLLPKRKKKDFLKDRNKKLHSPFGQHSRLLGFRKDAEPGLVKLAI